jgi:uncharacterized protein YkwD
MKKSIICVLLPIIVLSDSSKSRAIKVKGYFPSHKDFPSFDINSQHNSIWEKSRYLKVKNTKKFIRETHSIDKRKVRKQLSSYKGSIISREDRNRKQQYLASINRARSIPHYCGKYGLFHATTPLQWSDKLYKSANGHSIDMAIHRNFSHEGSGDKSDEAGRHKGVRSTPSLRASYYRYRGGIVGENIALGYGKENSSIESAIKSWLSSDSHCANLMSPQYRNMGMSLVENRISKTKSRYYWSQELGT